MVAASCEVCIHSNVTVGVAEIIQKVSLNFSAVISREQRCPRIFVDRGLAQIVVFVYVKHWIHSAVIAGASGDSYGHIRLMAKEVNSRKRSIIYAIANYALIGWSGRRQLELKKNGQMTGPPRRAQTDGKQIVYWIWMKGEIQFIWRSGRRSTTNEVCMR